MADTLRKIMVDGLQVETTDAGATAIEKLMSDLGDKKVEMADMKMAHHTAIAAKDEEVGTLKADLKKAQDAAPKPADIDKMVADRAALVTTVKAIDAKIEVAGKSEPELRKAAVASKLGDEMVKDASDAEIAGMFKAIAKDVKPIDPFRDTVNGGLKSTDSNVVTATAHKAMTDHMTSAWQGNQSKGAA